MIEIVIRFDQHGRLVVNASGGSPLAMLGILELAKDQVKAQLTAGAQKSDLVTVPVVGLD